MAAEMRKIALNFYKELYRVEVTDPHCRAQLLKDLPELRKVQKETLDLDMEPRGLALAVQQLSSG